MNEIELVELLSGIYRKIMKRVGPIAKAEGISKTEMIVLWQFHKRGFPRVTELSAELGLPPSTLTGILDRLVAGGWLERVDDPEDRRAVILHGTPKLEGFIDNTMKESSKDLARVMRKLPPELLERLSKDLSVVLGCLDQEEEMPK
jgi:DNA-binding MarR family transcriptional regulator